MSKNEAMMSSADQAADVSERTDAIRDLFGVRCESSVSFPQITEETRKHFREALETVSKETEDRQAYDEAMEKAPDLVQLESNPDLFLKVHRNNHAAAAKALHLYWKERAEVFQDRAFRPMTIVKGNDGALTDDEIDVLTSGVFSILPDDEKNRAVFLCQRSQWSLKCAEDAQLQLKIFFYLFQTLMESEVVLEEGVVGLTELDASEMTGEEEETDGSEANLVNDGEINPRNKPHARLLRFLQAPAHPIQVKAHHIIAQNEMKLLESALPLWGNTVEPFPYLRLRSMVHLIDSEEDTFSQLQKYGFNDTNAPQSMGGRVIVDNALKMWIRSRVRDETTRYGFQNSLPENEGNESDEDIEILLPAPENREGKPALSLEDLATAAAKAKKEQAKARKRKLDAIYQKRKRDEEKAKIVKYTAEKDKAENENDRLKRTHKYLTSQLERVQRMAEAYEKEQEHNRLIERLSHTQPAFGLAPTLPSGLGSYVNPVAGLGSLAAAHLQPQLNFHSLGNAGLSAGALGALLPPNQSLLQPVSLLARQPPPQAHGGHGDISEILKAAYLSQK